MRNLIRKLFAPIRPWLLRRRDPVRFEIVNRLITSLVMLGERGYETAFVPVWVGEQLEVRGYRSETRLLGEWSISFKCHVVEGVACFADPFLSDHVWTLPPDNSCRLARIQLLDPQSSDGLLYSFELDLDRETYEN